jgi:electron transfer flavoprotein alpha subunit
MKREILIIVEHSIEEIDPISYELIFLGKILQKKYDLGLSAVLIGHNVDYFVNSLNKSGVNKIYNIDDKRLEFYCQDEYIHFISKLINQIRPRYLILGATRLGYDLAPRIATIYNSGLLSNIISLDFNDKKEVIVSKPIYDGKLIAKMKFLEQNFNIITLLPGSYPSELPIGKKPEIIKIKDREQIKINLKTKSINKEEGSLGIDISQAEVIVAGGRGLREEGAKLLLEFANNIGAAVGASRPAVEAGWFPYSCQIGISGKKVKPKIYISFGISGAYQHLAGMKGSKCIIAINIDNEAQIFNFADFGIIQDIKKIIPCLIQQSKFGIKDS